MSTDPLVEKAIVAARDAVLAITHDPYYDSLADAAAEVAVRVCRGALADEIEAEKMNTASLWFTERFRLPGERGIFMDGLDTALRIVRGGTT